MKLTSPTQQQGDHYETLARLYLEANGLKFFAKNWHYKNSGELDLVMIDESSRIPCVVIIEVRQRKLSGFGNAEASVTTAKQRKIIKATQAFLQAHPQFDNHDVRFDVVSFDNEPNAAAPVPQWLVAAFLAQ